MPTNYATTHALQLNVLSDSGGTLSWDGYADVVQSTNVTDFNDDGNLDQGTDFWGDPSIGFTGYTIALGGTDYPVYSNGTNYYVPYNKADVDLFGFLPFTDTTSDFGDNVVAFPLCFAEGTLIDTPDGQRPVESLEIGDLVCTSDGKSVPVLWLGQQTLNKFELGERTRPVRISAGALGGGLPTSDLTVTADHGMIIDGLVINASALVNGSTIEFVPMAETAHQATFYHIETEAHDAVLAFGSASETFIDNTGRSAFDNYQEYLDLYGADRIVPEMSAPRIASRRLLPHALKRRLGIQEPSCEIQDDMVRIAS